MPNPLADLAPEDDLLAFPPQNAMVPEALRAVLAAAIRRIPAGQALPQAMEPGGGAYRVEQPGVPVPEGVPAMPWSGPEYDAESGKYYGGASTAPRAEVLREIMAQNRRAELMDQLKTLTTRLFSEQGMSTQLMTPERQAQLLALMKAQQGLLGEAEKPTTSEAQEAIRAMGAGGAKATPVGDVGSMVRYVDPQTGKTVTRFVEGGKGAESRTLGDAMRVAREKLGPNARLEDVMALAQQITGGGIAGIRGPVAAAQGFQGTTGRGLAELQPAPGGAPGGTLAGAVAAARAAGAPIPAGERKAIADLDNLVRVAEDVQKNWQEYKDFFGPLTGRAGAVAERIMDVDPRGIRVRQMLTQMANRQVYAQSGAQISETEMVRLLKEAPQIALPAETSRIRLQEWLKTMREVQRRRRELQVQPAGEVAGQRQPAPAGKILHSPSTGQVWEQMPDGSRHRRRDLEQGGR